MFDAISVNMCQKSVHEYLLMDFCVVTRLLHISLCCQFVLHLACDRVSFVLCPRVID